MSPSWRFHAASIAITIYAEEKNDDAARKIHEGLSEQEIKSSGPALAAFTERMVSGLPSASDENLEFSQEHLDALDERRQKLILAPQSQEQMA